MQRPDVRLFLDAVVVFGGGGSGGGGSSGGGSCVTFNHTGFKPSIKDFMYIFLCVQFRYIVWFKVCRDSRQHLNKKFW